MEDVDFQIVQLGQPGSGASNVLRERIVDNIRSPVLVVDKK